MITRRTLLTGCAAAAPLAIAASAPAKPDVAAKRQGPTMDRLINLAHSPAKPNRWEMYYARVLEKALGNFGAIVYYDQYQTRIFSLGCRFGHLPPKLNERVVVQYPANAGTVLIPDSILPHIRPENRGDDFPRGIPFVELK